MGEQRRQYVAIAPHALNPTVEAARRALMPSHHTCGIDVLNSSGRHAHLIDPNNAAVSRLLRTIRPAPFGEFLDPGQLARGFAEAAMRKATVFAVSELSLGTAVVSQFLGRLPVKVVALVHGEYDAHRLARNLDGALCLTDAVEERMRASGMRAVTRVTWGPDLEFSGYRGARPEDFGVVALGRAGRDYETLLQAIHLAGVDAIVNVPRRIALPETARRLDGISRTTEFDPGSYTRPTQAFTTASVFVIPLIRPFDIPIGLTEVNDALALGCPIIMTRSPGLGFDIAERGIGIQVAPHDPESIATALTTLRDDPAMRGEMGDKAREFARTTWNYNEFRTQLDSFLCAHDF